MTHLIGQMQLQKISINILISLAQITYKVVKTTSFPSLIQLYLVLSDKEHEISSVSMKHHLSAINCKSKNHVLLTQHQFFIQFLSSFNATVKFCQLCHVALSFSNLEKNQFLTLLSGRHMCWAKSQPRQPMNQ